MSLSKEPPKSASRLNLSIEPHLVNVTTEPLDWISGSQTGNYKPYKKLFSLDLKKA